MVHIARPEDKHVCPFCGSSHVDIYEEDGKTVQSCLDCGKESFLNTP